MNIQQNTMASTLNNLLRLNESRYQVASERLASGSQLTQASDNSSGLQISERLTSQVNGTSLAIQNIDQGMSLLETADGGLKQIQDLLVTTKELLVQAGNGTLSYQDKENIQNDILHQLDAIDQLVQSTTFNGLYVLDGAESMDPNEPLNTYESTNSLVADVSNLLSVTNWQHTITIDQLATDMQISSDMVGDTSAALGLKGSFQLNGHAFSVTDSMSLTDIKTMINGAGLDVTADIVSNKLVLNSTITGLSGMFTAADTTQSAQTVTSSNTSVASVSSVFPPESEWSQTVDVQQLAQKMEIVSNAFASSTNALNMVGKFTVEGTTFSVTASDTLTSIRDMINNANVGVLASIDSSNRLHLQAATSGAGGTFTFGDMTFKDSFSDPASLAANWTDPKGNGNWTINSNQLLELSGSDWSARKFLLGNGTTQYGNTRMVSTGLKLTSPGSWEQVGVMLNYTDENNRVYAYVTESTKSLVIGKVVNGVASSKTFTLASTITANTQYNLSFETDGAGTYTAKLYNGSGTLLGTNTATGWTDAAPTGGSVGLVTIGGNASFGNFTAAPTNVEKDSILQSLGVTKAVGTAANVITQGQDAMYKIDGVSHTSSTNTVNLDHASITLQGTGTTVVSSAMTNEVLHELGILDSNDDFQHLDQAAQDAIYHVDNTTYQSSTNTNVSIGNGTIDLLATGTTTIQNTMNAGYQLKTINLHTGWGSDQSYGITLADMDTTILGLNSLRTSLTNGFSLVDAALQKVMDQRTTYGAQKNRLLFAKQQLVSQQVAMTDAKSRIMDADVAKEASMMIKSGAMQKMLIQMHHLSVEERKNMLSLLAQ